MGANALCMCLVGVLLGIVASCRDELRVVVGLAKY